MVTRRATPPLRVTERIDYALKSVLWLSLHDGEYVTASAVAEHFAMSPKLLGGVLWCLRGAGIVESRPGWHGGFRLARLPESIPLQAVIVAASGGENPPLSTYHDLHQCRDTQSVTEPGDQTAGLVAGFWQALDDRVQAALSAFTVADLAAARSLQ